MSDEENPITTSLLKSIDEEQLQSNAVSEPSVNSETVDLDVAKLQVQRDSFTEVSGTTSRIIFNVPQSDGSHQVWIKYHIGATVTDLITGAWYKGVQWNTLVVRNLPVGVGYYSTQWNYKGHWSVLGRKNLDVRAAPVVDGNDTVQIFVDSITGTAGYESQVTVVRTNTGTVLSETKVVGRDNRWSLGLLDTVPWGQQSITVAQVVGNFPVVYSAPKVINCLKAPAVDSPVLNAVIPLGGTILIRGRGAPFEKIDAMTDGGGVYHGQATVETYGSWTLTFDQSNYPGGGSVRLQAKHSMAGHGWSALRTFFLLAPPAIDAATLEVEMDATIEGTGHTGIFGHSVDVHFDLSETKIGGGWVVNGRWFAYVKLTPGSHNLTAVQLYGGVKSERATIQGFNVRPPQVELLEAVAAADGTVTIKGKGYVTAELNIHYVNDPNVLKFFKVDAASWVKTFDNWLPGTFIIGARQWVPGLSNAPIFSGWSLNHLTFTVPVPPPTLSFKLIDAHTPEFYGTGKNWPDNPSHVEVRLGGSAGPSVPIAEVKNGNWVSRAIERWAPGRHEVSARQGVNSLWSVWIEPTITVVIIPQSPVLDPIVDNGFTPAFSGTCWPGAEVTFLFSDGEASYTVSDTDKDGRWEYTRPVPFVPGSHTVTVTQTFGMETSNPASGKFDIGLPQSVITWPADGEEVDFQIVVQGSGGYVGSMMKIVDWVTEKTLGEALVGEGGVWAVRLVDLEFARYSFFAQATFNGVVSNPSDRITVEVVLMPPLIDLQPTDTVARTFRIEGKARPTTSQVWSEIELWLDDQPLSRVRVRYDGFWWYQATLPLGHYTLKAKQFFGERASDFGPDHQIKVAPAPPMIEIPAQDEPVGQRIVVAGFGYAGDTVAVAFAHALDVILGTTVVQPNGSWSLWITFSEAAGPHALVAQQSFGEFVSAWTAARPFVLRTDPPTFTRPEQGEWVSPMPTVEGTGKQEATVHLCAWYDPDVTLATDVPVVDGQWATPPSESLRDGPGWVRAWQTVAGKASDVGESHRFEVSSMTTLHVDDKTS
ncbi:hypothetical protein [Pseudomonas sp. BGI-2]|uniref:hypothetical protein n=1 Tax=Pseudomonas sp. BGI-2 TaxID=2528211 RepID=UPI0010337A59|nr:hypothetical protein [Pseudomonas sp. BGI-2]TBN38245.1 hypothetical protein EYC95_22245 [Pseudomonas sp. BGI-2]